MNFRHGELMKKPKAPFASAFLFLFYSGVEAASFPAKEPQPPVPAISSKTPQGFDFVLLMDSSGSMEKTDPRDYRKLAARLFISLLGEKDRIGVISFGDSAKVLLPLTENRKENRDQLLQSVDKITSQEFSTHIHEGVKTGLAEVQTSPRENRVLILMSDGKLTLGDKKKEEAALRELFLLLPEIARRNIKIYAIAFTENADAELLEETARKTGGFFKIAKTDRDLHTIYASIFEKIKSPDAVPLKGETFHIDKDIQEAILLITKKPGASMVLFGPSGEQRTSSAPGQNARWEASGVFDLISIQDPAPGNWRIKLTTQEGNRIYIATNLRLKTSLDKNFVAEGERIQVRAWLEREAGRIDDKDFLAQVSFAAQVKRPDKALQKLSLTAEDSAAGGKKGGEFAGGFVASQKGEYTVRVAAESKTFQREKIYQFVVTEKPIPSLEKEKSGWAIEPLPKGAGPAAAGAAPLPQHILDETEIPWQKVLVKLGLVNLAFLLGILGFRYGRKLLFRKSKEKT